MPPASLPDAFHLLRLSQLELQLRALGDVAHESTHVRTAARIVEYRVARVHDESNGSIRLYDAEFLFEARGAAVGTRLPGGAHALQICGIDAVPPHVGVSIEVLGRSPPDLFDCRADIEHALWLEPNEPKPISTVLREQPEPLLARAQLRFRLPSLVLLIRRNDRATHGARQSFEALLQQVVGRPEMQALHGLLLPQRSGDDDHRHVRLLDPCDAQRRNPVIIGEVEVAEDDLIGAVLEGGLEADAIAHLRDVARQPRNLESVVNQFGIPRIVLQMQQAHGSHDGGCIA